MVTGAYAAIGGRRHALSTLPEQAVETGLMARAEALPVLSWRDSVASVLPYWGGKLSRGRRDDPSWLSLPITLRVCPVLEVSAGPGALSIQHDVNA